VKTERTDVQPGLRIHQSNRLERLADALGRRCREPAGGTLESEQIVVPNAGMGRWLSLRLADRLGVCLNVEFRFPAAFVWSA
jgi:exodeoxyribonuclease V gamma subunit